MFKYRNAQWIWEVRHLRQSQQYAHGEIWSNEVIHKIPTTPRQCTHAKLPMSAYRDMHYETASPLVNLGLRHYFL